jgi:hypothetical protein
MLYAGRHSSSYMLAVNKQPSQRHPASNLTVC